jgi:hypothetical protein
MRVNDPSSMGVRSSGAEGARPLREAGESSGDAHRTGGPTAGGGDRIEFSATLGGLSRAISAHREDRAGRIAALAAQYRSGAYQVDARATSSAMIAESLAAGRE